MFNLEFDGVVDSRIDGLRAYSVIESSNSHSVCLPRSYASGQAWLHDPAKDVGAAIITAQETMLAKRYESFASAGSVSYASLERLPPGQIEVYIALPASSCNLSSGV